MEICMACGKPIEMGQPSYYRMNPKDDIEVAVAAERERCAKIVEVELELPGDMPPELHLVPLEDALRAAVRATKKNIAAAIRAPSVLSDGG